MPSYICVLERTGDKVDVIMASNCRNFDELFWLLDEYADPYSYKIKKITPKMQPVAVSVTYDCEVVSDEYDGEYIEYNVATPDQTKNGVSEHLEYLALPYGIGSNKTTGWKMFSGEAELINTVSTLELVPYIKTP